MPLPTVSPLVLLPGYLAAGRAALAVPHRGWRIKCFAAVNVAVALWAYADARSRASLTGFATYAALTALYWVPLRLARLPGAWPWLAFALPVGALAAMKWGSAGPHAAVGASYQAFRLSYLALEVRNALVPFPTLCEYLGFAFFVPTFVVGPISRYAQHRQSLEQPEPAATPALSALARLAVGAAKFLFLGNLANQVAYTGLLLDGRRHGVLDLGVAAVAYYLYLYCNFSGFCDMAIGAAGLLRIRVSENFDAPLAARNLQDFWNRWHITLSAWMRDVLFTPLSKELVRRLPPKAAPHALALTITVVFLVVGVWHGTGWQYFWFGALHAAGVVAHHYYVLWLKRRLGKAGMAAYTANRAIAAAATAATFAYVSATFFVFANDADSARRIWHAVAG